MNQRYINGMLITSERLDIVNFTTDSYEGANLSPIILEEIFSRSLFIYYKPNQMNTILKNRSISIKETQALSKIGSFNLYPRVIINGVSVSTVQVGDYKEPPVNGFRQLICMNIDKNSVSKIGDDIVILIKSDLRSSMSGEEYCKLLNDSGLVRADIYDINNFIVSNISGVDLVDPYNEVVNSTYINPVDLKDQFWLSSPELIANFIKSISSSYKEIQFYNNDDALNLKDYKEHIKYTAELDDSDMLTSYMLDDDQFGRMWKGCINLNLDYMTHDLPLLIRRRDEYKSQKWLNEFRTFNINKTFNSEDLELTFGIFWHRNEVQNQYSTRAGSDGNDINKFSFPIRCTLLISVVENNNTVSGIIEIAIKNIIANEKF